MAGILQTKVTERAMLSRMKELNGTILTMMDMEIIHYLRIKEMLARQRLGQAGRTALAALTEMEMAILTKEMYSLPITLNGQILMVTDTATITITMLSHLQNGTQIKKAMHSQ